MIIYINKPLYIFIPKNKKNRDAGNREQKSPKIRFVCDFAVCLFVENVLWILFCGKCFVGNIEWLPFNSRVRPRFAPPAFAHPYRVDFSSPSRTSSCDAKNLPCFSVEWLPFNGILFLGDGFWISGFWISGFRFP